MSLPPPLPLARIREHEDEPNRESPPPGEPLATFSDDLQPLFQQLVFECKVHSALYGAAFACLSHAFHRWLHARAVARRFYACGVRSWPKPTRRNSCTRRPPPLPLRR